MKTEIPRHQGLILVRSTVLERSTKHWINRISNTTDSEMTQYKSREFNVTSGCKLLVGTGLYSPWGVEERLKL